MTAPRKPLDPYTLRHLARKMRAEAKDVWYLEDRLLAWARECERLARQQTKRPRGAGGE